MVKRFLVGIMMSVMPVSFVCGCGNNDSNVKVRYETTERDKEEESEADSEEATTETASEEATTEAAVATEELNEADGSMDSEKSTDSENSMNSEASVIQEASDNEKKVEYGSTIKVHFVHQGRGAVSKVEGEFVVLNEGDDEIEVTKENLSVFCPYDYDVEESVIMDNVNKAVGLKVGDKFTIGCEGGDGYYETIYEIIEIK